MAMHPYIGARYVPRFMGTYDPTQAYEALDVVDNGSGTSYISKIPTDPGTPLTDGTHWTIYGASSAAIMALQTRVDNLDAHTDLVYDTVSDIPASLAVDTLVGTRGFYTIGDGGSEVYQVVADDTGDRPTIQSNGNYLMVVAEPINILAIGCKLEDLSFDNSSILNNAFSKWNSDYFCPSGNLHINHTIVIPKDFIGAINFDCSIHAYGVTDPAAVQILAWNSNDIYIRGVFGNGTCDVGVLVGDSVLQYYVINETIKINRINNFRAGMKLAAGNNYGVTNNKFYLTRIDNCDVGIEFECYGDTSAEGFISQNQFYNLWVTGDGTNTKKGLVFKSVKNVWDFYTEDNFFNLSCEGCGTVVEAQSMATCHFQNIRLGEQGNISLPDLFKLGDHCINNEFDSIAPNVRYNNITDQGENNRYYFNFFDPVSSRALGREGSFHNGLFILKGPTVTAYQINVGAETTYVIEPCKSPGVININRVAAAPVEITLPNNADRPYYCPPVYIKLESIGGGVKIKRVDGTVVAASDGSGQFTIGANQVWLLYCNWEGTNGMIRIS